MLGLSMELTCTLSSIKIEALSKLSVSGLLGLSWLLNWGFNNAQSTTFEGSQGQGY